MHSHERTLLASLGFQDRDKKNPLHDLACRFLAESEQARRLVPLIDERALDPEFAYDDSNPRFTITEMRLGKASARIEEPVFKGDRFRTTIGFIDVAVSYEWEGHEIGKSVGSRESAPHDRWSAHVWGRLMREVKIGPVPVSDIVRQINLYREYVSPLGDPERARNTRWFLAVPYALSEHDAATLERERIRAVRLGDGFRRWVAETKASGAAQMPEF